MKNTQLAHDIQNTDLMQLQEKYMARLRSTRIAPNMLHACEELDLSAMGKDLVRNLRSVKRSFAMDSFEGLYLQINPAKNWSATLGILPEIPSYIEQEDFFQSQVSVLECRGNTVANELYYDSRKTPCEDAVKDYLILETLIVLKQALKKEEIETSIYIGISHSDICFAM